MPADNDFMGIANESGFPLQIAVERSIEQAKALSWKVQYVEHAWTSPMDEKSGFIDLVVQDEYGCASFVIECKRVRHATWLFMHSTGHAAARRHAKAWVSSYSGGTMKAFGWEDLAVDPACPEGTFCCVRGQSTNDRITLLERVGAELVSATEAFAGEQRDYRKEGQDSFRLYFTMVVTTADLKVAKFDPANISLADGVLSRAQFEDVPYVRLRKQLSLRPLALTTADYMQGRQVDREKEHTLFVVRADRLVEFLRAFDIPNSSLRTHK